METLPAPDVPSLEGYLAAARELGASDLRLSAGGVPLARIEGELRAFESPPLLPDDAEAIARDACEFAGHAFANDVDTCFEIDGLGRFRANVHVQRLGAGVCVKLVPRALRTLHELGLPEELYELTRHRIGLVLVTGPTGCGKSSTLAALLQRVNESRRDHIITIEDPIEFVFESALANVTQRQVGDHTRSFATALRASLREDPDVILVAELRDLETIRTAILAAETGHLVLGTLHTRDAASTISRVLDVFPAREQAQVRTMLAASLRSVVSQRLLPRQWGGPRVPAYEVLHVTPAIATKIRDGKTHQIGSALQTGRRHGMIDFDACLEQLVRDNHITQETAFAHAKDRVRFAG